MSGDKVATLIFFNWEQIIFAFRTQLPKWMDLTNIARGNQARQGKEHMEKHEKYLKDSLWITLKAFAVITVCSLSLDYVHRATT